MISLRHLAIRAIYSVPALVLFLARVRIIVLTHPERIGHLCLEPDCYIKEEILGLRKKHYGLFLISQSVAANKALLEIWSAHLPIVTSNFWCALLYPLTRFPKLTYSTAQYAVAIDDTAKCAGIYTQWHGRPKILTYPADKMGVGRSALAKMGLPAGAWFVCVHSREGGYSPGDEHLHSYRNSDIRNYALAMDAIVQAGGWCIRVGESSSRPCVPMAGVIDYAHSPLKGDWMDVFLCANCLFFLGNSSGLYMLSSVFGVPSALANLIPVSGALPVAAGDIGIPKKLHWKSSGKALTFAEILANSVGNFRFSWQYEEYGMVVEENSPEEIRDMALEMLDYCQGKVSYTDEDESLQRRFRSLFKQGHYSFGAASRIGRGFLRKYEYLIDS